MWVVVFGVFYFLLIRPQKKKDKELKEMRENMDDNDIGEFDKFLLRNWGIKMKSYEGSEEDDYSLDAPIEPEHKTSKRGRKPKAVN